MQEDATELDPVLDMLDISGFAYSANERMRYVDPLLRVDGMDERLAWPVLESQRTGLHALVPDGRAIIVPGERITCSNTEWTTTTTNAILASVNSNLGVRGPVALRLKHMAIDVHGDAASVASDSTDAIGRVLVLLPSVYSGGALTFKVKNAGTQYWSSDDVTHVATPCYMALFTSAEILIAPIVAGARSMLVYDLVSVDEEANVALAPAALDLAASFLQELALLPPTSAILGYALDHPHAPLSHEILSYAERRLVHALVTAGCYDVVLVQCNVTPYSKTIVDCFSIPRADVPSTVQSNLIGKRIDTIVNTRAILFEPTKFIAFWPTRTRPAVVGLSAALASLCLVVDVPLMDNTDDRLLGTFSPSELALAVLPFFGDDHASNVDKVPRFPLPEDKSHFEILCGALAALGDVAVTSHFIAEHLTLTDTMTIENVAAWLHATLTTVGWGPLLPALTSMLTRWCSSYEISFTPGFQLVASLAGVVDDPVCPPLDMAFAAELIKPCWSTIMTLLDVPSYDVDGYDDTSTILAPAMLLEAYITSGDGGGWFTSKVPATLCAEIDAYRFPTHSIQRCVDYWMSREPIDTVAPSLAAVVKRNPQLCINKYRAALTNVLATMSDPGSFYCVRGLSTALTLVTPPTILLERLWHTIGLPLLPALFSALVTGGISMVPSLSSLFMYAANAFEPLTPNTRHQLRVFYVDRSPLQGFAPDCCSTYLVLDALAYFRTFDVEMRSVFAEAFIAATTSTPEATAVFRNLDLRCGASDIILAKAGLERIPIVEPRGVNDLSMTDALPHCACEMADSIRTFLASPTRESLAIDTPDLCDELRSVIAKHRKVLELHYIYPHDGQPLTHKLQKLVAGVAALRTSEIHDVEMRARLEAFAPIVSVNGVSINF
ncbi:hypothetical protein SPRG_03252 [Saprolegnia parasitica CBS 223.65]|uniref:Uncharacterized protein n=1 Tax=Saprolegnia parasitica (strain CBS 223.65) TaxID=695850 RepID=A0A067CMW2_SAPPC|nr:hypothetical protein SPRG_03252 [Saprolegnia parasitica CBS 223.65]KDO32034.1 hypothetical protein SPRG_03252 [Saprolegnia parasitica CBS 223.65]|eukprot:XP_012197223.1 hypothetical protein SPRG_03252 [Saprolegnia parasitica CBS 223.65]